MSTGNGSIEKLGWGRYQLDFKGGESIGLTLLRSDEQFQYIILDFVLIWCSQTKRKVNNFLQVLIPKKEIKYLHQGRARE